MRAIKLVKPKKYQVIEYSDPIRDDDNVIIDVERIGMSDIDISVWSGSKVYGFGQVVGNSFCGIVTDRGDREDICLGDRVIILPLNYCGECDFCKKNMENLCNEIITKGIPGISVDGACAEKYCSSSNHLFNVDSDVSPGVAALAVPIAIGHHTSITVGRIQEREKVLVVGTGGMYDLFTAWWAKQQGAFVVLATNTKNGWDYFNDIGFGDEIINLLEKDAVENVRESISMGFDYVIDCNIESNNIFNEVCIPLVRKGGKIIQVGKREGRYNLNLFGFHSKELSLLSSHGYSKSDFEMAVEAIKMNYREFENYIKGIEVVSMEQAQKKMLELAQGKLKIPLFQIDPRKND